MRIGNSIIKVLKVVVLAAVPVIIEKGGEAIKEWVDKKSSEKK